MTVLDGGACLCCGHYISCLPVQTHATAAPSWSELSSLSEVSTLAMEFSYLTRMTGARDRLPLKN